MEKIFKVKKKKKEWGKKKSYQAKGKNDYWNKKQKKEKEKNRLIETERELDISVHCIYLLTFELFTSEGIVRSRNQMEGIIIINEDDISRMDD